MIFLVPPLILFAVVVVYPAVSALRLSFTDANLLGGSVNWVGWDNFADALGDKIAWSWQQIVLALILYLAGLSSVPPELAEAARVDGGNRWQVFRKVTFPLLAPVTTVVLSLVSINSLRNFDLVFAMTEGGPVRETETLPLLVFRVLLRELQQGEAAAIALLLFLITLAVVGMFTWWGRSKSRVL